MNIFEEAVTGFMAEQKAAYDKAYAEATKLADAKITDENNKRAEARPAGVSNAEKAIAQEQASREQSGQPALTDHEQAEIRAQYLQGLEPLSAAEKDQIRQSYLSQIEQPWSRDLVESQFAHLKPMEDMYPGDMFNSVSVTPESIYKLADGRLYSIATGEFVAAVASGAHIVELGGPATNENLRETLIHYKMPVGNALLSSAEITARTRAIIDEETSNSILAGFDYEINGETLHFSYDAFDQQNFADKANACMMRKAGAEELPKIIKWKAYRHESGEVVRLMLTEDEFLALYAGGALNHKDQCMELGDSKKAQL